MDLNRFTIAYLELYEQEDRDEWLRGFALGVMGGRRIPDRSMPFNSGLDFGKEMLDAWKSKSQKCSIAGARGYAAAGLRLS